ncbi:hypothetical protein [Microbispora sp. ATCC PTA-5024]|uniref:hypothetical protein n=1 Tax=Microbispora sp. ATCC PTA-5024 TaxID=316330 RepID=UPI0003DD7776|nr:hypothetical protein [Microbispora sp. ATCC PTA-5024]ETK37875.1 hypothetical protein MPTA5024_01860 [Microbispora sp. ATCC PTA-5024]
MIRIVYVATLLLAMLLLATAGVAGSGEVASHVGATTAVTATGSIGGGGPPPPHPNV